MELEVKFHSIAKRWLLRVFAPMALVVVVLALTAGLIVRSYFHSQVRDAAEEYAGGFSLLAGTPSESFSAAAREYCEQFEYKDKLEIMVLDRRGNVLVSTSGFARNGLVMPDYKEALTDAAHRGLWLGRSSAGESVMCGTSLLFNSEDVMVGAVRWAVSMKRCDRLVRRYYVAIMAAALAMLLSSGASGLFFIKSIALPVRQVSAAARRIASGNYKELLTSERDDEIGELCDSINYMETELKRAEEMKNDFISSVSHELRTPLTAIRGWAETAALSVGTDNELVGRGLEVVISESERLAGLVEELLDFSRIQNGRLNFEMQPICVSDVVSEAADMYRELAATQGIEMIVTPPAARSTVNGDRNRLKQVFVNIVDNAVKYTGEKGQVLISETREDGCVKITVQDTGVGIPAADIDRVKEKFYKANKEVRGSGIGLAVADEIVKQHSGLLFLESTEGIGTTVTVVLPLYEPEEQPAEVTELPAAEVTDLSVASPPVTEDSREPASPQPLTDRKEEK